MVTVMPIEVASQRCSPRQIESDNYKISSTRLVSTAAFGIRNDHSTTTNLTEIVVRKQDDIIALDCRQIEIHNL
jgi:hypothetical protein